MHTAATPTSPETADGAAVAAARTPVERKSLAPALGSRPTRSLFWRIFLWFWLAMLLLAVAVTLTVYITDPDQFFPHWHYVPLQRIDQLAAESVSRYESGGQAALHDYLIRLPRTPASSRLTTRTQLSSAYLFDAETGLELSGQTVPADTRELVDRAKGSPDLQLERFFTQALMARAVRGVNGGHDYVLLLAMPRSNPLLPTTPQIWLQFAAALATSALVCYWLARNVVAPVRRLQIAARRLAGGDLTTRVSTTPAFTRRRDEFFELAHDFDDMASQIEDLLVAQKRLIADISHELGSPLTRVNVALGLAFRKAGDAVRPELERIEREARRLNELIRQLLLLSELENRAPDGPLEMVNLSALVQEVANDAEFEASGRRCRVRVVDGDGQGKHSVPIRLPGVPHLLHSAVENVVRNAVRYTAEDSEVSIELASQPASNNQQTGPRAVIRVRDHGPGVPPLSLAHLFRPFYRVSEARDRQSGGTGLGLAITQQAVLAHGGAVRASNHPAGGLLVEIELRISQSVPTWETGVA